MKKTIDLYDFRREFEYAGRENQFSYEALGIIFDWIEQLDADTGEDTELDVIGICCSFDEASSDEIAQTYSIEFDEDDDEDDKVDQVRDYLYENTSVCGEYEDEGKTYFVFIQF